MARQFNGSSDYLVSAANVDLTSVGTGLITVAFWLWWNTYADTNERLIEHSTDADSSNGAFEIRANWDGAAFLFAHDFGGGYRAMSIARPSAAAWHHYLFVVPTDATANAAASVDGATVTVTSAVDSNGGAWGTFPLYLMAHAGTSQFGAGRLADLAIWSGNRTSYAALLAAGARAATMAVAPLYAWRIGGTASPEPNTHGGVDLTVNGATFVDDPGPLGRRFLLVR